MVFYQDNKLLYCTQFIYFNYYTYIIDTFLYITKINLFLYNNDIFNCI